MVDSSTRSSGSLADRATAAHRFLIWGAGGHGRVVADLVRATGGDVVGYADANAAKVNEAVDLQGAVVLVSEESLLAMNDLPAGVDFVVPGIGSNLERVRGIRRLGGRCANAVVHPSAVVSAGATVGKGTVVLAGAVINVGAAVGEGVIVNTGAIVEHDCTVGDGVHLSPGAVLTGAVSVGRLSWIGANATILPGLSIGAGVTVGAGSVVLRSVPANATVVGNPARPLLHASE